MLKTGSLPSRVLALVLLAAGLGVAYQFAMLPVFDIRSTATRRIERANVLLQKSRELTAQRSVLVGQLSALRDRAATLELAYLQGRDDSLAAAELLELTRSAIERAGGDVNSAEVLPAESVTEAPWSRRIAVSVETYLPINGLANALYALESGQPYVLVDGLIVRGRQLTHMNVPGGESGLDVILTVFGYRLEKSDPVG
jgi:Type II secretion system (T2SS), protein M subtype b